MSRPLEWTKEQVALAFEMRERGKTYAQIGIQTGHTRGSVASLFFRHGKSKSRAFKSIEYKDKPLNAIEIDTLHLLSIGKTRVEISLIHNVTPHAIHRRIDRLTAKVGVHNSVAVVAYALRNGWIE